MTSPSSQEKSMSKNQGNPYAALDRIFHEPNRLAIMSALAGADDGMTFNDLKAACSLTDGNLSRHLKTLEDAGMVSIEKTFKGAKPLTTVSIADLGRKGFAEYLATLEHVLQRAAEAMADEAAAARPVWQPAMRRGWMDVE